MFYFITKQEISHYMTFKFLVKIVFRHYLLFFFFLFINIYIPNEFKKKSTFSGKMTKTNKWIEYIQEFRKANPGLSWKQALKNASPSYRKENNRRGPTLSEEEKENNINSVSLSVWLSQNGGYAFTKHGNNLVQLKREVRRRQEWLKTSSKAKNIAFLKKHTGIVYSIQNRIQYLRKKSLGVMGNGEIDEMIR